MLVVEDEYETREAMVELLGREGYNARGSANGAEAFALLKEGDVPSLILLDLLMPVMDGWEFCRVLGSSPELAEIPIAIVSATGQSRAVPERKKDAGLFRKPVDIRHLLKTVRSYCG